MRLRRGRLACGRRAFGSVAETRVETLASHVPLAARLPSTVFGERGSSDGVPSAPRLRHGCQRASSTAAATSPAVARIAAFATGAEQLHAFVIGHA